MFLLEETDRLRGHNIPALSSTRLFPCVCTIGHWARLEVYLFREIGEEHKIIITLTIIPPSSVCSHGSAMGGVMMTPSLLYIYACTCTWNTGLEQRLCSYRYLSKVFK